MNLIKHFKYETETACSCSWTENYYKRYRKPAIKTKNYSKRYKRQDSVLQSQFVYVYGLKTIIKDTENLQSKQQIIIKDTTDKMILTHSIQSKYSC